MFETSWPQLRGTACIRIIAKEVHECRRFTRGTRGCAAQTEPANNRVEKVWSNLVNGCAMCTCITSQWGCARSIATHAQIEQIPVHSDSEGRLRSFARSGSLRVSYSMWAHDYSAVLSSASPRRSFNDYTRHVSPDTFYADDRLDDQRRLFAGLLFFSRRF